MAVAVILVRAGRSCGMGPRTVRTWAVRTWAVWTRPVRSRRRGRRWSTGGPQVEGVADLRQRVQELVFAAVALRVVAPGHGALAQEGQLGGMPLEFLHRLSGGAVVGTGPLPGLGSHAQRGEHLHLVRCEPAHLGVLSQPGSDQDRKR